MDEAGLRLLAETARARLPYLVPDEVERALLDRRLAAALAQPPGRARPALVAALSSHPALHDWIREHADWPDMLESRPTPPSRYLSVEVPQTAPPGCRLGLLAWVTLRRPAGMPAALKPFDVPPEGATVTITVSAPGFEPVGDLEQDLHVPADGDSEPIRFGFVTRRPGLHTLYVRAFRGGTFLGELSAQVAVESAATIEQGEPRTADLGSMAAEQGEVTLEVGRDDGNRYRFRLIGEGMYPVELSKRLAGDPRKSRGHDGRRAVPAGGRHLAAHDAKGATLAAAQPRGEPLGRRGARTVRRQFWEQRDRIGSFTIASDTDAVPWELRSPADGRNDEGFLVEQFPVLRRVHGQGRSRLLTLRDAAYVVPPNSPENALDEVRLVRAILGNGVTDLGEVRQLGEFAELLDNPPSLLHFACHNEFSEQTGSMIRMGEGPLSPADLAMAVQTRSLRQRVPLVFLNSCRTADEIPGLTQTMGWAKQFMAAGAGAFVGSLWAVRSSAAQQFAAAFYESLVMDRLALGPAALQARRRIVADDGDPTWLAYTIYGNPAATATAGEASRTRGAG